MALNSIFKSLFVHTRLGSWIKAQVLAASGKHASELLGNGCQFFRLESDSVFALLLMITVSFQSCGLMKDILLF